MNTEDDFARADQDTTTVGRRIVEDVLAQGRTRLSEHEAKRVLEAYGIPISREQLARSHDELSEALRGFSFPVVLKVDSPDILHKTEAGLVLLDCRSAEDAHAAFDRMMQRASEYAPGAAIHGVLVQEMLTDCTECIVGMRRDEQFGPTIMFGLGGIFVEVFEDVALRVAPLTRADAEQMVKSIKGYKILAGARGRPRANVEAIVDVLLNMSRLALDLEGSVAEIDVNPLMVGPDGQPAKAADALMLLSTTDGGVKARENSYRAA